MLIPFISEVGGVTEMTSMWPGRQSWLLVGMKFKRAKKMLGLNFPRLNEEIWIYPGLAIFPCLAILCTSSIKIKTNSSQLLDKSDLAALLPWPPHYQVLCSSQKLTNAKNVIRMVIRRSKGYLLLLNQLCYEQKWECLALTIEQSFQDCCDWESI